MSEKYYDASGSATHLSLILISLLENPNASRRQVLSVGRLVALVVITLVIIASSRMIGTGC